MSVSFGDIRGQDRALSFLRGVLAGGRISHAYIFHGPVGVGKMLTAMNFAKAANCLAEGARPCDACVPCRKADSSNHPDISLIKPGKEGGSVTVDDIRALIKDASLKPYEAQKKFYIIDEADGMKEEAANAFLKTLEEPPSDSVFILVAENLRRLPATIVSRSQTVKFFALRTDEVREILIKYHGIEPARAHLLSVLSSGRPGDALKYADEEFFAKREKVI
ncbi:DNA polymerase III delta prime subunit, partial [sediment metagenome]